MNKKGGDGEGVGSESLSITFRYINLTGLSIGLVELCGPMYLCVCVNEEGGNGEGPDLETLSMLFTLNRESES